MVYPTNIHLIKNKLVMMIY